MIGKRLKLRMVPHHRATHHHMLLIFSESGLQHQSYYFASRGSGEVDNIFLGVFSWRGTEWSPRVNGTALSQRPQFELVTGLSYVVAVLSNAIKKERQRKARCFFFFATGASHNTEIQYLPQAIMQLCFHNMEKHLFLIKRFTWILCARIRKWPPCKKKSKLQCAFKTIWQLKKSSHNSTTLLRNIQPPQICKWSKNIITFWSLPVSLTTPYQSWYQSRGEKQDQSNPFSGFCVYHALKLQQGLALS